MDIRKSAAQYLHHLSILVDTDMNKMPKYLIANKLKMKSKGTSGVKSHVINMIDISNNSTHNRESMCYDLTQRLKDNFMNHYNFSDSHLTILMSDKCEYTNKFSNLYPKLFDSDQLLEIQSVHDSYNKLCDRKWIFGETPEFTHDFEERFEWGTIRLEFFVKNNIIKNVTCYTDSIYINIPETIKEILINKFYSKSDISLILEMASNDCNEKHMKNIILDIKNMIYQNMS